MVSKVSELYNKLVNEYEINRSITNIWSSFTREEKIRCLDYCKEKSYQGLLAKVKVSVKLRV